MTDSILVYELKSLLNKIKSEYVKTYPIQVITVNYLILAILDNKFCAGHEVLSKVMMNTAIEDFRTYILDIIQYDCLNSPKVASESVFSDEYDNMATSVSDKGYQYITSADMLYEIVNNNDNITKYLIGAGVTNEQLHEVVTASHVTVSTDNETKSKSVKKKKSAKTDMQPNKLLSSGSRVIQEENKFVENACVNMVRQAANGMYDNIVGFDDEIQHIFDILGKYERNTVAIVGDRGVGKTALIQKLAYVLYKQECPRQFREKYLVRFEDQINSIIISEMNKQGKYIAFIDDLERLFANKDAEANNIFVLTELFNSPNISTVLTANSTLYAKLIESKPEFSRLIHKMVIEEPSQDRLFDIVKSASSAISAHNSVEFSDDNIKASIRLAKQFVNTEKSPRAALNILDTSASYTRMRHKESNEIINLRKQLDSINDEINSIPSTADAKAFDRKDELVREKINITKRITVCEQKDDKPILLTESNIKAAVSEMTNIPMTDIDTDERQRLKDLQGQLQSVVIGQDDAIEDICRAVRRQRVGLSNPDKPVVMLFVGTTGTGKSFLAKRLAYEMFGDEKNMVRLDMSEYADKTSVNKLYGTSPGYIGYEEGGILTEAIKKKNRCVLLLDEIEKAHEDVYNVLLQVFDEGRLSDNKGNLIDFKNVIIIMTSNVGAKNVTEKVSRIGFGKTDAVSEDKEIIFKAIKKEFKPEFINRIDNICYFNKLTDDNLRSIIKNEIEKVHKKVINLGYDLDDEILTGKLVDSIFEKVKEESEYGARPIIREIQKQLEDKLTDYIINNTLESGYIFTYNTIYSK